MKIFPSKKTISLKKSSKVINEELGISAVGWKKFQILTTGTIIRYLYLYFNLQMRLCYYVFDLYSCDLLRGLKIIRYSSERMPQIANGQSKLWLQSGDDPPVFILQPLFGSGLTIFPVLVR